MDGNREALISAVESRCIRAIECACGAAVWLDFNMLSMESWALSSGGKLCVRRKSRSWFFGTKFPQALHGILGTLFWRKTLRAAKKPQLIFWNKIPQAPHGILGTLFWRKTLRAAKKPQLTFWNKISTGSPWNLGHSLLVENFACGEKPAVDFLEQNSTGSPWNPGHSVLAENLKLYVQWKNRSWSFGTKFPQVSVEKKPVGFTSL